MANVLSYFRRGRIPHYLHSVVIEKSVTVFIYRAALCSFSRRSSCALADTMMVERLIATAQTLRQIESPSHEKASRDRNGDEIVGGRPNEILDHLSTGSSS